MIDCCELALYNSQLVFKVVIGAFAVISLLLAMFFGYNLKLRKQQVELSKRTEQLERKNGSEQKQINELKTEIAKLKNNA
jgi:cell division protein FtsL